MRNVVSAQNLLNIVEVHKQEVSGGFGDVDDPERFVAGSKKLNFDGECFVLTLLQRPDS